MTTNVPQITKEEAIAFHDSKQWEQMSDEGIVQFQLFQSRLAMPFDRFHEAVEKILARPVFTHEFAFADKLMAEYLGRADAPTMNEIIALIPQHKRIVVTAPAQRYVTDNSD